MLSAGACGAACLAADGENTEQPRIERRVFRTSVTTGSPLQNPELAYYVVLRHTVAYWVATVSDTTRCDDTVGHTWTAADAVRPRKGNSRTGATATQMPRPPPPRCDGVPIARARRYRRLRPRQALPKGGALWAASAATHWQPRVWSGPRWAPNRERHITPTFHSGSCQSLYLPQTGRA